MYSIMGYGNANTYAWLHVCTLYTNYNIVVTLMVHLQQF
jgi:hypothetical protein